MNIAQILNGVTYGSLLMILSSGLAMIYGLRGVANFSHGALYMSGAYLAYSVSDAISFWLALIVVPMALAVIGAVMELAFFRRLQDRDHIAVGLVTFGIAMIMERLIILAWGSQTLSVDPPSLLDGTTSLLGTSYPTYRLAVIVVGVLLALALTVWIRSTRTGLQIRAASHDVRMSAILGMNVDRVSLIVVCVGAALAGIAGALAAPYYSVHPGMGGEILVLVMIVVMIGGIGSIGGSMIAGMALGIVMTVGAVISATASVLVPYVALALVLLWRPTGLAGKRVS